MTIYTLYCFRDVYNKPYYAVGNKGKYAVTGLSKKAIDLSISVMTARSIPPEDMKIVATFTTYEDLVNNYPELFL
jgi:hypothetical protein